AERAPQPASARRHRGAKHQGHRRRRRPPHLKSGSEPQKNRALTPIYSILIFASRTKSPHAWVSRRTRALNSPGEGETATVSIFVASASFSFPRARATAA